MSSHKEIRAQRIKDRFRGFLPVIVDVETSGVDPNKNALLEMCIVFIEMDTNGYFTPSTSYFEHILPFDGAELDPKSLEFNQIDPWQPLRFALDEKLALENLFSHINVSLKKNSCQRAVLVGHNAWFDLLFIKEAAKRSNLTLPFHAFTCFDTATLSAMIFGQTVLAKAAKAARIPFNTEEAHSAIYDAQKTADLFCAIMNTWRQKLVF